MGVSHADLRRLGWFKREFHPTSASRNIVHRSNGNCLASENFPDLVAVACRTILRRREAEVSEKFIG